MSEYKLIFFAQKKGCGLKNFVVQDCLHCKKSSKKTRLELPVQQLRLLSAGSKLTSKGKSEESNAPSGRSKTATMRSLFDSERKSLWQGPQLII